MDRVNGIQILRMCQHREFKDGDMLIAFQEDSLGDEHVSIYKFKEHENGSFSFIDVQYECELEVYDLSECNFIIVKPKRAKEEDVRVIMDEWYERLREAANKYGSVSFKNQY